MKQIFASSIWTRVILALAIIFIVWSVTLIVSVKQQQTELAQEVGVINKLNGIAQSIFALEKSLETTGPDSSSRWRGLYSDYRTRRAEFDPGDPNFRDLQVNLIRTDSLLIRLGRLHADWGRAGTDLALQKSLEADFYREINIATTAVQSTVQTMQQRTGRIAKSMADNWNALFVLVLFACALALAVTMLLRLLQEDLAKINEAEAAQRGSAERARQAFEQAPSGMATSTLEGKFIQVNPAFCKLLGYTEAELLQRQVAEISHPDDLAAHRHLVNRLQRGEMAASQLEKRYLNKKQQTVYTLVQASLMQGADGATPHLVEQVIDLTERTQAEFAHRQSEARFRELAENIDEVFWLTDPAKNEMLYVSAAYEKIWDRSCQSLYETPHTWIDAIHPEERERVRKAALTKQVIGQYDETYRIQRPDGETRWVRDRAFPIRDEQGSVYRLAGLAEDITERKQIEAAFQEAEQRWNFAIEGSDAGVWDWEVRTNKVFYSRRWKEMLGHHEHEIGDSLDESYSRIHPEDLSAMIGALEKHLRGETPVYLSAHRKRCKDGSYKWIQDRGKVVLRTAEGRPLRVVGTHTDIDEPARAKTELRLAHSWLNTFIENLPSGILCEDHTRHAVYLNQKFCDLFGIPLAPAACAGMDWRAAAEQAKNLFVEKESFVSRLEEILAARQPVTSEELRLQDGRVVERDYIPIFAEQEYAGHLWHYRDITAIKQAGDGLRKSEERFRLSFEMAPSGMTITGIDGVLVQCNRAFCEMLGYTAEELQGKTWVDVTPPDDVSTNIALRERLLRGDIPNFQMQKHYLAKDGQAVHALLQMTLVKDEQGRPLHFVSQTENLTALKQAEEEIRQLNAELEQRVIARTKELQESEERFRQTELRLQASEARLRKQNESLGNLVRSKTFQTANLPEALEAVTEAAAHCLEVERVSVWFYDAARTKIICRDLFELSRRQHTASAELQQQDFLPYFAALSAGRDIDAHDAQNDNRTRCFGDAYLRPLNITSMLDAPIRVRGELVGVLCHEHIGVQRQWSLDEQVFTASMADLVAQALESSDRLQAEQARRNSEERYRTLVETMNDGLVQLDEKGLLIYVNDKMCEMTGFPGEQLLGREVLPRLDAESQNILRQQIERRQNGESKPYEMEIRKKDGGKLPVLVSPQPIFGFDGRFSGSFAVVTDISDRKHMEEQIRQHAEELERLVEERARRIRLLEQQRAESEKLAATGRMSARIAHEINNPLAGIKNSFLLVKDGIPTTHRYYDYVRRIETEIERIARIVRQMFDLYRPQQDSVRSFPADLAIRDVVALLRTNCRERDITIDVDINAPVLNVALSEGALRQVLYNVIQNAVDASPPGSTVRVRAFAEQQQLLIHVSDPGPGIPEEIRTQIFEPFFTTKSGFEHSGLGLGLSVSKGLVEAMGGKLDFESTVGKGTTFVIALPLDAMHNKALATLVPQAPAKSLE